MKSSEMIKRIQELVAVYGDCEMIVWRIAGGYTPSELTIEEWDSGLGEDEPMAIFIRV